jgi:type II restriction-modification system restriction subunit
MDAVAQSTLFRYEEPAPEPLQPTLFDLLDESSFKKSTQEEKEEESGETIPLCIIYDWQENEPFEFQAMKGKVRPMNKKFYAVIGNPPYQEEVEGTSDRPIFNYFMDAAYEVGEKVELITPARFLFNAGKTPKAWNKRMLNDPHLTVLDYEQSSSTVFANTDIKGGVAVTLYDVAREDGPIGVFSSFSELRSIQKKIIPFLSDGSLDQIMFLQNKFVLHELYADYPEAEEKISSDGKERRIVTSSFSKLPCFTECQTSNDAVRILGLGESNKRIYKWIERKYIEDNGNLDNYKVIVPKANGSGAIGEVLSTPLIGEPLIGYTQSFIGIGSVSTESEAEAILKYVKSKFARAMLGILKITQDNPPERWTLVPLQDFTLASDINWSKSVSEIDQQLYAKYGLSDEEIEFIESHVKEMN